MSEAKSSKGRKRRKTVEQGQSILSPSSSVASNKMVVNRAVLTKEFKQELSSTVEYARKDLAFVTVNLLDFQCQLAAFQKDDLKSAEETNYDYLVQLVKRRPYLKGWMKVVNSYITGPAFAEVFEDGNVRMERIEITRSRLKGLLSDDQPKVKEQALKELAILEEDYESVNAEVEAHKHLNARFTAMMKALSKPPGVQDATVGPGVRGQTSLEASSGSSIQSDESEAKIHQSDLHAMAEADERQVLSVATLGGGREVVEVYRHPGFKESKVRMGNGTLEYDGEPPLATGQKTVVLPGKLRRFAKTTRKVAIKYTRTSDEKESKRLVKELDSLAKMETHPNILKYYGGTVQPYDVGGREYVVLVAMELLECDLHQLFFENEVFPEMCTLGDLVNIFLKISKALEFLHERGIIHHDLKPANILVSSEGAVVKIADFGTSRILSPDVDVLVNNGRGSMSYMAPEIFLALGSTMISDLDRCQNKIPGITKASDVYSLGCVMWECLNLRKIGHRLVPDYMSGRSITWGALGRTNRVWCNGPSEVCDLVEECLNYSSAGRRLEEKDRPTAAYVSQALSSMLSKSWVKCKVKGFRSVRSNFDLVG